MHVGRMSCLVIRNPRMNSKRSGEGRLQTCHAVAAGAVRIRGVTRGGEWWGKRRPRQRGSQRNLGQSGCIGSKTVIVNKVCALAALGLVFGGQQSVALRLVPPITTNHNGLCQFLQFLSRYSRDFELRSFCLPRSTLGVPMVLMLLAPLHYPSVVRWRSPHRLRCAIFACGRNLPSYRHIPSFGAHIPYRRCRACPLRVSQAERPYRARLEYAPLSRTVPRHSLAADMEESQVRHEGHPLPRLRQSTGPHASCDNLLPCDEAR